MHVSLEDTVNNILNAYLEGEKSNSSDTAGIEEDMDAEVTSDMNKDFKSARDFEKDIARQVFRDRKDWRDMAKMNTFLRRTKDLVY